MGRIKTIILGAGALVAVAFVALPPTDGVAANGVTQVNHTVSKPQRDALVLPRR